MLTSHQQEVFCEEVARKQLDSRWLNDQFHDYSWLKTSCKMSGSSQLENANPVIFQRSGERQQTAAEEDEDVHDPIDDREIFDILYKTTQNDLLMLYFANHPLSLEELNVVEQVRVQVNDADSTVSVEFTPTIPHCSMATLIGLSIKVKLLRSLPSRFKVGSGFTIKRSHLCSSNETWFFLIQIDVHITPGTHASEAAVNKQLADKERVAAALENSSLLEVVNQCLTSRSL
ncbi:Mitotic spindle-associated MMXD complex subunit MIP18 [Oryzias melastigma]|uniref:Cytosolic iron-sulfur assembly component 2B n=1 Tax=Oryzias melastigma TaxID=30732 RepID=A0A834FP12_ORYME|nr:Mitotic spindle-associated MMXD complex subunit MIP18 [Oryzias melastigma]